MTPLMREEDRGGERLGEQHSQFVFEQDAGDPHGHAADREEHEQAIVRIDVGVVHVPQRREAFVARLRQLAARSAKSFAHVLR
jgi:hypothetical protein